MATTQTTNTATNAGNTSGSAFGTNQTDANLSQAFGRQANISGTNTGSNFNTGTTGSGFTGSNVTGSGVTGTNVTGTNTAPNVNTTYAQGVQPQMYDYRHHGPGHCYHHGPHKNRSIFDVQGAYQNHYKSVQQGYQQQGQQGQQFQQGQQGQQSGGVGSTARVVEQEVKMSEEQYKAAKEEERIEVAKFEEVRNSVNALITSQDWNRMESAHVHNLGTQLRDFERRFWDLKPAAERLVLKGRNRLAERLDLAEEELQHAIVVVSQIYRNRVKVAAHTKFPGKRHPRDRGFIGHGHQGHYGSSEQGGYGVQPYHGHPYMGSGGYY